jgi:hypothetical protein
MLALLTSLLSAHASPEQYQTLLRTVPQEILTYENAHTIDSNGYKLDNVVVKNLNGKSVLIDRVTIGELDLVSVNANRLPNFLNVHIKGIRLVDNLDDTNSNSNHTMEMIDVSQLIVNATVNYRTDPVAQVLTFSELGIELEGLATLTLALEALGITLVTPNMLEAALTTMVKSATLSFHDISLLRLVISNAARDQGKTEQQVLASMQTKLRSEHWSSDGADFATPIIDTIIAFLSDYPTPHGPLTIRARPSRPVSIMALVTSPDLERIIRLFKITAVY